VAGGGGMWIFSLGFDNCGPFHIRHYLKYSHKYTDWSTFTITISPEARLS